MVRRMSCWRAFAYALLPTLMFGGSFALGQQSGCQLWSCIKLNFWCTDASTGWGTFDAGGVNNLTNAFGGMYSPRTGGGSIVMTCSQCVWKYGCDVDCDCTSFNCTGTLSFGGSCPTKDSVISQYTCSSS